MAVVAAVGAILAVQLVAYYVLMRGRSERSIVGSAEGRPTGVVPTEAAAAPEASLDGAGDHRRCPGCGAPNENEAVYSYCQHCGEKLT